MNTAAGRARAARLRRAHAIENAVRTADVDTVRQLLAGTRPPIPGPSLIDAVTRQDPGVAVEMTRLLIEHGANVNATAGVFSPLFAAVSLSPPEVVRLLLRPMPNGMSTLDLLACKDRPEHKKLIRKFLAMRVRRCVLGPVSEHPRRQVAREVIAPKIAAFLV